MPECDTCGNLYENYIVIPKGKSILFKYFNSLAEGKCQKCFNKIVDNDEFNINPRYGP